MDTKEEQEIEDNIENFVPLSKRERQGLDRAIEKARKERAISLRIKQQELYRIKEMAQEEGIPYQTFIGSILHKYITHQLVGAKEVKKIVAALK